MEERLTKVLCSIRVYAGFRLSNSNMIYCSLRLNSKVNVHFLMMLRLLMHRTGLEAKKMMLLLAFDF